MKSSDITPGEHYACKLPEHLRSMQRRKATFPRPWRVQALAAGVMRRTRHGNERPDGVFVRCQTTDETFLVPAGYLLRQFDQQLDYKARVARYHQLDEQRDQRLDEQMRERHRIIAGALTRAGVGPALLGVRDEDSIGHRHTYDFEPHQLAQLLAALGHLPADALAGIIAPEPPANPRTAEELAKQAALTPGRRKAEWPLMALAARIIAELCEDDPRGLADDAELRARLSAAGLDRNKSFTAHYQLESADMSWNTPGQGWQLTALGYELIELIEPVAAKQEATNA